ncbi:efflux RND transporter permease subunit [Marinobacter fonticola]|uniref:efflux RND transporter permease subunit n=1 Tax=Marinobacter fonticola TaxID=2603215 RepID=UPI0011E731D5|nr:efflux RND transporter permease subunit [Marinobacter fonticola]
MQSRTDRAGRFYHLILTYRWLVIFLGISLIVVAAVSLPGLAKDTSAGAFIDPENPALRYRENVKEVFGLSDPIVVAVANQGPNGIFNPPSLGLVSWLTEKIQRLDNVDPERVMSLATESNVIGNDMGIEVHEFLDPVPTTQTEVASVRAAVENFPLYQGSLVARDGRATLVVVELLDEEKAQATYDAILELISSAPKGPGDELLVAGEGAVAGYLSSYIDQDAQRLNPFAGLIITLILFLAFRTVRAALLPNAVILATVVITLGLMAASNTPFYVITNGLIVCMIGIAVADSIHVFSQYYEELRKAPTSSQHDLIIRTMQAMTRPVTFTTLTTAAGFLSLYPTTDMPPIQAFGLFGALAVTIAWVYTLSVLPAIMSFLKPRASKSFRNTTGDVVKSPSYRLMDRLGRAVLNNPRGIIVCGLIVAAVGAVGLSQVQVEDQRIANFKPSEPLYQADKQINTLMDGTYHLDVVVETPEDEGLHDPARLRKIEKLQRFLEEQPHVNGTTSIVDYIKQINRAVNENQANEFTIPDNPQLIAQLFLLYATSGSPTDFEEEIDTAHRQALVRAYLDTNTFANNRQLVPVVREYLTDQFNEPGLTATLTGRVNVDYHWINGVAESHAGSVIASVLAVLLMASAVFRSVTLGVLAVVPVAMSILLIYAVMGFMGIWLGVGTSMFAAIAIGLGVDSAIHTLERVRELGNDRVDKPLSVALTELYPTTGRALFFNLAAVGLGFGVLCLSDVPPLVRFGGLVALAVSASFIASITLLPALVLLVKPACIVSPIAPRGRQKKGAVTAAVLVLGTGMVAIHGIPDASAEELPEGAEIMSFVAARPEGQQVTRNMVFELTDRRDQTRTQEIKAFRRYFGDEKRTALFYTAPANVRGTGFLTYDYASDAKDDDQWLYLPALRKVRRIPASNRGDYFLGTDFSYEEIKSENKVSLKDYEFRTVGKETIDGVQLYVVEGTAATADIAKELGYSKAVWRIDPAMWISRKSDYWDVNGNHLKTIKNLQIEKIDDIWTVLQVRAINHKSGHSTLITSSDVDYQSSIPARTFEKRALVRGQ